MNLFCRAKRKVFWWTCGYEAGDQKQIDNCLHYESLLDIHMAQWNELKSLICNCCIDAVDWSIATSLFDTVFGSAIRGGRNKFRFDTYRFFIQQPSHQTFTTKFSTLIVELRKFQESVSKSPVKCATSYCINLHRKCGIQIQICCNACQIFHMSHHILFFHRNEKRRASLDERLHE